MGVHLTFVRSVDLDEWTQRQIDAMRLGGNGNAREFFRKHGFKDLSGGKIDKKYKSKAAVAYRAELAKLVEAEAAKRGEGIAPSEDDNTQQLLENLEISQKKEMEGEARAKLAAARNGSSAGVLKPSAKLASSMPGANKLVVTPPSSGGLPGASKGMLRKPASGNFLLKKKSSNVGGKLRVNKLSVKLPANNGPGTSSSDHAFEDVEATQKAVAEAEKEAKQVAADEEMARKLQEQMNDGIVSAPASTTNGTNPPAATSTPAPKPAEKEVTKQIQKQSSGMDDNMARLKAMNSDFFTDM